MTGPERYKVLIIKEKVLDDMACATVLAPVSQYYMRAVAYYACLYLSCVPAMQRTRVRVLFLVLPSVCMYVCGRAITEKTIDQKLVQLARNTLWCSPEVTVF